MPLASAKQYSIMTTVQHRFDIIPVPTEAGTHFPGQCKAPQAIIKAGGLPQKMVQQVNGDVEVHGEDEHGILGNKIGAVARWQPSDKVIGVRNLDNSLRLAASCSPSSKPPNAKTS